MVPGLRSFIGTILIIVLVIVYALAATTFASLLLGTGSGSLIQNFKDAAAQSFYTALYMQDDWRVTRRLTLNLGVRYDLDSPRTERFDRINYFDPDAKSPLAALVPALPDLRGGLVFVGEDGRPRSQYKWDTNNIAPRIGFAYLPSMASLRTTCSVIRTPEDLPRPPARRKAC